MSARPARRMPVASFRITDLFAPARAGFGPVSTVAGVGLTPFGRHEGHSTLDLMSRAAADALTDAELERGDVDGLITGYSTTHPHLMLSTVFAEHFGLRPTYAHAVQLGGATGFALVMLAHLLVEAGAARRILVVAGRTGSRASPATPRSRPSRRSAIPSTRCRSARRFPPITASSPPATPTNTASRISRRSRS